MTRRNGQAGGAASSSTFGNSPAGGAAPSTFNNGAGPSWSFEQQLMQNLGQSQNIAPIPNPSDNSTATALDAMFGHSNFTRAMQVAQSTPASQLTTPFYELLMQNLSHQPSYPPPTQPYVQATPQQTRSGRISRPPVAPLAQNDLMRVMGLLNGPGMEPVRAAMEASGLLDGYNLQQQQQQQQRQEEEEGQRQNAMTQALQMLLAAQSMGQPQAQAQAQSYNQNRNGQGEGGQKKGKKRGRKDEQPQPRHQQSRDGSSTASPDSSNLPAPTKGKGSRLAMPKEDIISRRKERNKASAQASRQRKQTALEMSEEKVKVKEEEVKVLSEKCERLERELEDMRQLIHNSGIHIPTPHEQSRAPTPGLQINSTNPNLSTTIPPTPTFNNTTLDPNLFPFPFPFNFNYPSFPDPSNPSTDLNGLGMEGNDAPFDFNMFMNMDSMEDEEADGDFQPETSPIRGSDTDGERDEVEGEGEDIIPNPKRQRRGSKSKSKSGKSKSKSNEEIRPSQTPDENRYDLNTPAESIPGNEEEDFIDPEMEDEDLFLPIEDVPIPPSESSSDSRGGGGTSADVTGDMMKALKVDTRDQLAAVMQKLVDSAGEGGGLAGVDPGVVEKLKSVIMMAQAQRAADKAGGQSREDDEESEEEEEEED